MKTKYREDHCGDCHNKIPSRATAYKCPYCGGLFYECGCAIGDAHGCTSEDWSEHDRQGFSL